MSSHAHPGSTTPGASRKRKDRDGSDPARTLVPPKAERNSSLARVAHPAPPSNRLLAGYLAHEFLTKGTLFGRQWDAARPEPEKSPDPVRPPGRAEPQRAYVEVSQLLKAEGVQIPGVVNPTQLARWLENPRGTALFGEAARVVVGRRSVRVKKGTKSLAAGARSLHA